MRILCEVSPLPDCRVRTRGLSRRDAERANNAEDWDHLQRARGAALRSYEMMLVTKHILDRKRRCLPLAMTLLQWINVDRPLPEGLPKRILSFLEDDVIRFRVPYVLLVPCTQPTMHSIAMIAERLDDEFVDVAKILTKVWKAGEALTTREDELEATVQTLSTARHQQLCAELDYQMSNVQIIWAA